MRDRSAHGFVVGLCCSFLMCAALTASLAADEARAPQFKKLRLTEEYYAEGAEVGDFNHDGKLDIVCGPNWFEGPTFQKRHTFYDGKAYPNDRGYSNNFFSYVDDFSGDGRDDILVIGLPGTPAHWYENPGDGKSGVWKKRLAFPAVDNEAPVFDDLTGDGKAELICTYQGRLGYATPRPEGEWTWHAVSEKGKWHKYSHGLGIGDVNGDGRKDFLMPEGWWEQPESWDGETPWKHHPVRFGPGGAQIWTDDVDGDGDSDVVTSLRAHAYGLSWFEQIEDDEGQIAFREHLIMGKKPGEGTADVAFSQLHAVDLKDVNGDGLRDIVCGKCYWAHNGGDPGARDPAVVYWFELRRTAAGARYVPHLVDDDSGVGRQVNAADVNGDGLTDIVCGNKKGTFLFLQLPQTSSSETSAGE